MRIISFRSQYFHTKTLGLSRHFTMNTENDILMPRESGKFIAEKSTNVFIDDSKVKNLAGEIIKNIEDGRLSIKNFSQSIHHPDPKDPKAADWIFVLDTLNFSFWSDVESEHWKVNGESGYFALCAAMKRAIDEGIPITDAKYIATITHEELEDILKADDAENISEIPLLDERVKNLNEVGRVLIDKYNGTFKECIKSCNNSAKKLLELIVRDFECFRDEAVYKNQRVSLYKRAQILVGDIWACFQGQGLGAFDDIDYITMFADYRVPQVLLHFGVLKYNGSLLKKLTSNSRLEAGSVEEVEIRGCSIEAVEKVVKEIRTRASELSLNVDLSHLNAILVDHFLWDYRREHAEELEYLPYHKTRTIYY